MKYELTLNTGHVIPLQIENFQAPEFVTTINDGRVTFVSVGGAVINKHSIVGILPVGGTPEQAPTE